MDKKTSDKPIFWTDKMAEEVVRRFPGAKLYKTECGLGASGIPHVGSSGDGIRSYMVTLALQDMGEKSEFIAYSDDRDGLRKVPSGFDSSLEEHIGEPVSLIPDPFGCHGNYGEHMSSLLIDALDKIGIRFRFQSSDETYKSGVFDEGILEILRQQELVGRIIREFTNQVKFESALPFFAICENCGKLYTTRVTDFDAKRKTVSYVCDQTFLGKNSTTGKEIQINGCGHSGETSIRNGKLAWKVEFACRWNALGVHFEAYGKDILDSVRVNDEIQRRILGSEPPVHTLYEMFTERGGQKISKSKGNVFTPQVWLSFGSPESIRLLMLKRLAFTRVVDLLEIPKHMNEIDYLTKIYFGQLSIANKNDEAHMRRLYEYVNLLNPPNEAGITIPHSVMVNIAKVLPSDTPDRFSVIKEILAQTGHIPQTLGHSEEEELKRRIAYATEWLNEGPEAQEERQALQATPEELNALARLADELETKTHINEEQAQQIVFSTAQDSGIEAKRFFRLFYQALLGLEKGPRAGKLISVISPKKVANIIRSRISQ